MNTPTTTEPGRFCPGHMQYAEAYRDRNVPAPVVFIRRMATLRGESLRMTMAIELKADG